MKTTEKHARMAVASRLRILERQVEAIKKQHEQIDIEYRKALPISYRGGKPVAPNAGMTPDGTIVIHYADHNGDPQITMIEHPQMLRALNREFLEELKKGDEDQTD